MEGGTMEQWVTLKEFADYSISDEGRARNDKNGKFLTVCTNGRGHPYVSFWKDMRQSHRTIAGLVALHFLPPPPENLYIATPIHLNSDLLDCRAVNLAWRPLWFAQKFTRQFKLDLGDAGPLKNIDTGECYDSVWDVVYEKGVLFNDVIQSIYHKTYVFPLMQCFEWM
jgi:hypothetical protein